MTFLTIITSNMLVFWFCVFVLMVVIEGLSSFSLTTIWAAIAALLCVFISYFSFIPALIQGIIFLVISIVLMLTFRSFALKKLKMPSKEEINTLEGKDCIVCQKIEAGRKGAVRMRNGVIWTAEADNNEEIDNGISCIVTGIDGNILKVRINQ